MLNLLKSLVRPSNRERDEAAHANMAPPTVVGAPDASLFDLGGSLVDASGFPAVDWQVVQRWVESIPSESAKAEAWSSCERAWLEHLRVALGSSYRVRSQGSALLLSTLPANVADATPEWGHDILVVFDEDEAYYRYVSYYYPEAGEFAASSGMYLNRGCGHFVTVKTDLRSVEPVIAHELTHSCLSHLPIPAWLNEGLAVNTELRLCPPPQPTADLRQMHARHRKFWGPVEIQEFWSGKSFLRNDQGNELSYDLARILVSEFAADWDRFRQFVLASDMADAASSSAKEHLGVDLGAAVCAVLERDHEPSWESQPRAWHGDPERGAF